MKKILSVILAVVMASCMLTISAVPAIAAVHSPTASTAAPKGPVLLVNGSPNSTDISYSASADEPYIVTFTYTCDKGSIVGWETNLEDLGLVEGTDYTMTFNKDGSLTISFISGDAQAAFDDGEVSVNAIVDFAGEESSTTKKNDSSKSPATGVATTAIAGSIAAACAGFAVLSAKKKDAE